MKRRCHRCRGTGRTACTICGGTGDVTTGHDVFGRPKPGKCPGCFGLKHTRCTSCSGEGFA